MFLQMLCRNSLASWRFCFSILCDRKIKQGYRGKRDRQEVPYPNGWQETWWGILCI
jgi:hypothetical protein